MKITHREHGTSMARMDRTMRGTAERYIQWKNRTLSFDPGPTRYTHGLGIFLAFCYGLFFLTLTGCAAFMTWVACIIGFLPGALLGAIGSIFFGWFTCMMGLAAFKATALLIFAKKGFNERKVRGSLLANTGNSDKA